MRIHRPIPQTFQHIGAYIATNCHGLFFWTRIKGPLELSCKLLCKKTPLLITQANLSGGRCSHLECSSAPFCAKLQQRSSHQHRFPLLEVVLLTWGAISVEPLALAYCPPYPSKAVHANPELHLLLDISRFVDDNTLPASDGNYGYATSSELLPMCRCAWTNDFFARRMPRSFSFPQLSCRVFALTATRHVFLISLFFLFLRTIIESLSLRLAAQRRRETLSLSHPKPHLFSFQLIPYRWEDCHFVASVLCLLESGSVSITEQVSPKTRAIFLTSSKIFYQNPYSTTLPAAPRATAERPKPELINPEKPRLWSGTFGHQSRVLKCQPRQGGCKL